MTENNNKIRDEQLLLAKAIAKLFKSNIFSEFVFFKYPFQYINGFTTTASQKEIHTGQKIDENTNMKGQMI